MKNRFPILLALSIIALTGCNKDTLPDPDPDPGPGGVVEYTLAPQTVEMDGPLAGQVEKIDAGAITFRSGTPSASIPQVGQIIVNSNLTAAMPHGFLGRVTASRQEGGKTILETEAVALDEAFEELTIDRSIDLGAYATTVLDPDGNPMAISRASVSTRGDGQAGISLEIPIKKFELGNEVASLGAEGKMKLTLGLDFDAKIIQGRLTALNVVVTPKVELSLEAKAALSRELKEDDMRICTIPTGPIPLGPVVIVPEIRLGLCMGANGEISLTTTYSVESEVSYGVKYGNNKWEAVCEPKGIDPENAPAKITTEFTLKGQVWAGLNAGVFFGLYGTVGVGVSVVPKGVFAAEFKVDADNLLSGKCYSDLKQTQAKGYMALSGSVFVEAQAFGVSLADYAAETPDLEFPPFYQKYILPHFTEFDVESDMATFAAVSFGVTNDLFLPVYVGVSIYDEKGNRLQTKYFSDWHLNKVDHDYRVTFTGLSSEIEYTAKPVCKLFGIEFVGDSQGSGTLDDEIIKFEDINFKYYLTLSNNPYDTNRDWEISRSEAEAITSLTVFGPYDIRSIKGIEHFKNLESFDILERYNKMTTVDISNMKALKRFACRKGQLTSLRAVGCSNLQNLYLYYSPLTSINLTGCTSLETLNVHHGKLTHIDISDCHKLTVLDVGSDSYSGNQLTSIDLGNCSATLETLSCAYNTNLGGIDLRDLPALRSISCAATRITSEIPAWIPDEYLAGWTHDQRYIYESVSDPNGGTTIKVTDRGYGLWYPGEPGSKKHSRPVL